MAPEPEPRDQKEETLRKQLRALAHEPDIGPAFTARVMERIEEGRPRGLWAQIRDLFQQPTIRRLATATSVPVAALVAFLAVSFATNPSAADPSQPQGSAIVDHGASDMFPVEFRLEAPEARTVSLSGDFNKWAVDSIPLSDKDGDGVWTVTVPLWPGKYGYNFVVDGEKRVLGSDDEPEGSGEHGPMALLRV